MYVLCIHTTVEWNQLQDNIYSYAESADVTRQWDHVLAQLQYHFYVLQKAVLYHLGKYKIIQSQPSMRSLEKFIFLWVGFWMRKQSKNLTKVLKTMYKQPHSNWSWSPSCRYPSCYVCVILCAAWCVSLCLRGVRVRASVGVHASVCETSE